MVIEIDKDGQWSWEEKWAVTAATLERYSGVLFFSTVNASSGQAMKSWSQWHYKQELSDLYRYKQAVKALKNTGTLRKSFIMGSSERSCCSSNLHRLMRGMPS
ncbi:TPA: hypothetical protein ACH3X2_006204 [Trebouxia sp. C0005]